ncbi:hypothetical protein [[Muricauda] lutisoli]|uniref:STAS/SEC14 domain-containing protein n=1 Tax=[Muricauda] lutisoli TaxID=2816035 RepID=A0ABS3EXL1_9FLAO|nr:hypothetical protein [[Muricauda] lutisoli]MBO0330993.1 hypothetical protein [[Muricauda] lutisoli]
MQRVKDLQFFKTIREIREYEFRVFYFFNGLVISEMKEGEIFDWSVAEKIIGVANEVLGKDEPLAYISNRIHNYPVAPTDWLKFYKHHNQLEFYSVVAYNQSGLASLVLEKMFFRNKIRQFCNLEDAIKWSVNEVNKKIMEQPG